MKHLRRYWHYITGCFVALTVTYISFSVWIKPAPWDAYYKKTLQNQARPFVIGTLNKLPRPIAGSIAIDVGAGIGNETIALLERGFDVIAIDNQKKAFKLMMNRPEIQKHKDHLKSLVVPFEKLSSEELPLADLITACFSLPFCPPQEFNQFWQKLIAHIKPGGYFIGNTFDKGFEKFGHEKIKTKMTFHNLEETLNLFRDFNIIEFQEVKRKNPAGQVEDFYIVIAQKR